MIKLVKYNEFKHLHKEMKEDYLLLNKQEKSIYFGYLINGKIVGVVGFVQGKSYGFYRNDFVSKIYRKQGIYKKLFQFRDDYIKIKKIRSYCTHDSLNFYLRNGFKIISKMKKTTLVERLRGR